MKHNEVALAVTKTTTREKFGTSLDPKKNIISEKNMLFRKLLFGGVNYVRKMLYPKISPRNVRSENTL